MSENTDDDFLWELYQEENRDDQPVPRDKRPDRRSEAAKRADSANAHAIAQLGTDLMNAFNHGKTDPSDMAILGHDTATGYEFCVERNGVVFIVSVARD